MPDASFTNFDTDPVAPLLHKQLLGEPLSAAEQQQVDDWKAGSPENAALYARLQDPAAVQQMILAWDNIDRRREQQKQKALARVAALAVRPAAKVHFLRRRVVRYAAAVTLLLGVGAYYITFHVFHHRELAQTGKVSTAIIGPGSNGAVLTLADGSQVVLDSIHNGVVASQQGANVSLQNGQLAYVPTGNGPAAEAFNVVSTPKGREFHLVLPDGSKVWLNAASSVRYPTVFTGAVRRVELEGEAYFEVTKNDKQPFAVAIDGGAGVQVLGTSFNINAYKNEGALRTTLLSGAVRMYAGPQTQVLQPGQQGEWTADHLKVRSNVDVDHVMAWKNGLFDFDNASLEEVMRQLERWYDITVIYPQGIPAIRFGGEINKQNTLQDVLQILAESRVHFRLEEGRKLIVLP